LLEALKVKKQSARPWPETNPTHVTTTLLLPKYVCPSKVIFGTVTAPVQVRFCDLKNIAVIVVVLKYPSPKA